MAARLWQPSNSPCPETASSNKSHSLADGFASSNCIAGSLKAHNPTGIHKKKGLKLFKPLIFLAEPKGLVSVYLREVAPIFRMILFRSAQRCFCRSNKRLVFIFCH